jgi:hypothetical protein
MLHDVFPLKGVNDLFLLAYELRCKDKAEFGILQIFLRKSVTFFILK